VNAIECSREQDVIDAVSSGRWPDRCDDALRAHVAACAICAEVAEVARAIQDDHEAAWRDARVPPSGRVWWRAEMRARQEAARKAARPITLVQGAAAVCAGGVLIALAALAWPMWPTLTAALGLLTASSLATVLPQFGVPLAIGIGSILLLTPVALYFVFSEK
jgi:hypothetical protein